MRTAKSMVKSAYEIIHPGAIVGADDVVDTDAVGVRVARLRFVCGVPSLHEPTKVLWPPRRLAAPATNSCTGFRFLPLWLTLTLCTATFFDFLAGVFEVFDEDDVLWSFLRTVTGVVADLPDETFIFAELVVFLWRGTVPVRGRLLLLLRANARQSFPCVAACRFTVLVSPSFTQLTIHQQSPRPLPRRKTCPSYHTVLFHL